MSGLCFDFPPDTPHIAGVGPIGQASNYVIKRPSGEVTIVYRSRKEAAWGMLIAARIKRDQAPPGPERDKLAAQYEALIRASR